MSSPEWREVYRMIRAIDKTIPRPKRRPEYSDVLIVAMYAWAVAHDRPQSWACDRRNYHGTWLPPNLPSQSRFSRRIRSPRCQAIVQALPRVTQPSRAVQAIHHLDSRPLPVGACSKDPEAKAGRVYGGFARGYRLHACTTQEGYFAAFQITSLNASEKTMAPGLLARVQPRGWILADGNYDSGPLYEIAAQWGGQMLATPRTGAGQGHRRLNPHRQQALALWPTLGTWAKRERKAIDRFFGQHSSYGGGLAPLPSWVRTLPRVTQWVTVKIALYHVRLTLRKNAA